VVGEGVVGHIEVLGPDAPSWKRGRLSVRGRGARDTYG
jgi:predicted nucleic acid-binding Zn ribbon protein